MKVNRRRADFDDFDCGDTVGKGVGVIERRSGVASRLSGGLRPTAVMTGCVMVERGAGATMMVGVAVIIWAFRLGIETLWI